ncbi:hypothetical protein [Psychrobacter sp.]|uniref:hypothetical protein n=1 Tax=Psychrobacter sp. TaxID=56811 RepID=UPI003F9AFBBB
MRFIKLTAVSAAVLASTAAMAADPANNAQGVDAAYEAEPTNYEAQPTNNGVVAKTTGAVRNTTGAVVGGTKTLFNTAVNPAAVSAEVGTLGYGANIGWALNENTELQAGWAGGDVGDLVGGDVDINDVDYDIDADFSNPYLGVQLRPTGNWFTMGAGIIVPDNDFDVKSNPNGGTYEINDIAYNADDVGTLQGTMEHRNKLAPYATIGFRPNITNNWGVFGEVGAAYMGKTDATIVASNPNSDVSISNGVQDIPSGLTSGEVAELAEKDIESDNYLEWMPIVKVGATYRF